MKSGQKIITLYEYINQNMKKILFLVTEDWYFISHRLPFALHLIKKGYEVNLCCQDTGRIDFISSKGIKVHKLIIKRKSLSFLQFFSEVFQLINAINKIKPNILHLISIRPIVLGTLAGYFKPNLLIITTFTGLGFIFTQKNIKTKILRTSINFFMRLSLKIKKIKIIVQNNDDANYLSKKLHLKKNEIKIIRGSGVDTLFYKKLPFPKHKKITFAYTGRILEDKGILWLITAFKQAYREYKNIRLILAGPIDKNNPSVISLDKLLKLCDQDYISYKGEVEDTREVWRKAHVAVLLSKREGLPLSLLEAAAVGRPIIATDVTGCREIAIKDYNAITVPPGNLEKTKQAIIHLARHKNVRIKLAKNGLNIIRKKMKNKIIFSNFLEIYQEMIEANNKLKRK